MSLWLRFICHTARLSCHLGMLQKGSMYIKQVRAMGLYTNVTHVPLRQDEILMWRSILYMFQAFRCAVGEFVDSFKGPSKFPLHVVWMGEDSP